MLPLHCVCSDHINSFLSCVSLTAILYKQPADFKKRCHPPTPLPQQLHNAQQFPTRLVLMSKCGGKCHNCLILPFFYLFFYFGYCGKTKHTTDGAQLHRRACNRCTFKSPAIKLCLLKDLRFSFNLLIYLTAVRGYYCAKPRIFFFYIRNLILCDIIDQMFIAKCDVYHIKLPSALAFSFQ